MAFWLPPGSSTPRSLSTTDRLGRAVEVAASQGVPIIPSDEFVAEAIRNETKSMAIRLNSAQTDRGKLERLADVLRLAPGSCPVQLIIETEEGAEAVLSLSSELRVEPNDTRLASLERLFGHGVAELR